MLLIGANASFGQTNGTPEKLTLPEIIPPSPTVAALMKFEEVPVEAYTGIPSISFPFYSIPLDQATSMDVSLAYHPSGVRLEETAGWAGMGWSLNAGGSISRTVYGLPDERVTYGIYDNNAINVPSPSDEIKWETAVNGKYDTQSDLYQFNFMGHSGRFFIKKSGSLQVVYLDGDNTYTIIPTFGSTSVIDSFQIKDNKGYIYTFGIYEISNSYPVVSNTSFEGTQRDPLTNPLVTQRSAWHLTSVTSPYGKVLCTLLYDDIGESINSPRMYTRHIEHTFENLMFWDECVGAPPETSSTVNIMQMVTKKLKSITVPGKGSILFGKAAGRLDIGTYGSNDPVRLKDVTIMGTGDVLIKKFVLNHTYEGAGNRLVLNSIDEYANDNTAFLPTLFSYHNISQLPNKNSFSKDHWGYYNAASNTSLFIGIPERNDFGGADRKANANAILTGLLKTITYPNGGVKEFIFESNQYSFIGNLPAQQEPNSSNTVGTNSSYTLPSNVLTVNSKLVNIPFGQVATGTLGIHSTNTSPSSNFNSFFVRLQPVVLDEDYNPRTLEAHRPNSQDVYIDPNETRSIITFSFPSCQGTGTASQCIQNHSMKGLYTLTLVQDGTQPIPTSTVTYSFNMNYLSVNSTGDGNSLGGGVRIKSIRFKDNDVVKKQMNYNYNFFDQATKSSGSITFLPKYYDLLKKGFYHPATENQNELAREKLFYVIQDFGLNNIQKTQGGDVGYKNVTVTETGNGRKELTYTTPMDYPEPASLGVYPYLQSKNFDYKRGLLQKEAVYNEAGKLLKQKKNTYEFAETDIKTGSKIFYSGGFGCPWNPRYSSYAAYSSSPFYTCSNGVSSIIVHTEYQTNGWAKLATTVENEYFGADYLSVTSTKTSHSYNSYNKQLLLTTFKDNYYEDFDDPFGTINTYTTRYYYPDDVTSTSSLPWGNLTMAEYNAISMLKANNLHRQSEPIQVDKTRNNILLSSERRLYNTAWTFTTNCLLNKIQAKKGDKPFETILTYTEYDSTGNVLEVKMENGSPIAYLWGYGKNQPIAKIENATLAETATALGVSTTALNAYDESNLSTINGLRTSLPKAMLTTLAYKPLVGTLRITDPRGYITRYNYDIFNRLSSVQDQDFNMLSENEYHYRTQN